MKNENRIQEKEKPGYRAIFPGSRVFVSLGKLI
jgi:hypothetical protein